MNHFNIVTNNILFGSLLAAAPFVFAAMFLGTQSVVASIAAAVAYLSLVVGERLDG